MNTIQQIAQWFLGKESMTHKKLQKLCYYAQAWHLALHGSELFAERFEAWVHGPVSPVLYSIYADYGWEKIPSETTDAHACGKVDAAEWQPARGAAARSASLIKKAFLNFYILNLKIFFHKILRYPSYPHFHIVTIHVSTFCGNVVDNPRFWAYFIHK